MDFKNEVEVKESIESEIVNVSQDGVGNDVYVEQGSIEAIKERNEKLQAEEEAKQYPDGFDATTYDLKEGRIIDGVVSSRLKENNDLKKQINDLKKIISKKTGAPDNESDYLENYKVDSKYKSYFEGEEGKKLTDSVLNLAKEQKLSADAFSKVLDNTLAVLEQASIIDTEPESVKQQRQKEFIEEQKKLLGVDAEQIINDNLNFVKASGKFNVNEKQILIDVLNTGAVGINLVNKIKNILTFDRQGKPDIPINLNPINATADVDTMRYKYKNAKDDKEAQIILKEAIEKGIKLY
jgi:hypothetical protein